MPTSAPNTRPPARRRAAPAARAACAALAAFALAGCEINKPEMPTFDTSLSVPLGVERLDVVDAVDGEDYLQLGDDGSLLFNVEGDPTEVSLEYDLSVDVAAQSVARELGVFALPAPAALDFDFTLGDVWAPAAGVAGLPLVVPPFPIVSTSPDQDLPDVENAVLASGEAVVRVSNGLPVPISADSGPDRLDLVLEDPSDGRPVAVFTFGAIAPGDQAEVVVDLAGATLPDRLRVRLAGGSPGSGGQVVTVDGSDAIAVDAEFRDLVVSSAVAVVDAQSVTTTVASALPADYEVTEAVVAGGALAIDLVNGLPLPCTASVTWPDVRDAGGAVVALSVDLAPGESAARTVDFAGCTIAAGGAPLSSIDAVVTVTSPGSGGLPVDLASTDAVSADIGAGALSFARLTGLIPEQEFLLDASEVSIDLPDELDGLELTAATLTLRFENATGIDARCDLTLTGTSSDGNVETLVVAEEIPSSYTRAVTFVHLDESNSGIVDFLNNLPERVTLDGVVRVGGDGAAGTLQPGDHAAIGWQIVAPVEVVVTGATLNSDPSALDLDADLRDRISTHALGAEVRLEVLNHLPLAAQVTFAVAADSTSLVTAPLLVIGPLDVAAALLTPDGAVATATVSRPVIGLTGDEARVFGLPDLVARVTASLPDNGGRTVRVLSTDYIEVRGIVKLDVLVDDEF